MCAGASDVLVNVSTESTVGGGVFIFTAQAPPARARRKSVYLFSGLVFFVLFWDVKTLLDTFARL